MQIMIIYLQKIENKNDKLYKEYLQNKYNI